MVHISTISFAKRTVSTPTTKIAGVRRTKKPMVQPKRNSNLQPSLAQSSSDVATVRPSPHKIGTDFENRALRFLKDTFSMSMGRVGGPSDGGVDLQGWWWLPPLQGFQASEGHSDAPMVNPIKVTELGRSIADAGRRRVRVLAQCKAESKPLGPHYIREMEGVLYGYLASLAQRSSHHEVVLDSRTIDDTSSQPSQMYPTIGMVISQSTFTKSSIHRTMASSVPLLLMHLPPLGGTEGSAGECRAEIQAASLQWNPALGSESGLLGGNLEIRWERESTEGAEGGRPFMYWKGRRLENWIPQDTLSVPA